MPFGEVFIEERNNKWNTPYLFNAKELNEETGLYYYGARYYDSRISLWLSTDPLQEKYPNVSTYMYCSLNPVKYIDPDGMDPGDFVIGKSKPTITHDPGFSNFPKEKPTWKDRKDYAIWYAKGQGASLLDSYKNSAPAYLHYLGGSGTTRNVNFSEYLTQDQSGIRTLSNALELARNEVSLLNLPDGKTNVSSRLFNAGGDDFSKFPYPATEDWQKTIGAFKMWINGEVEVKTNKDGTRNYKMSLVINLEDMYNFNPGQKDIKTKTPDSINGRFEVVGWAQQYINQSSHSSEVSWTTKTNGDIVNVKTK